MKRKKVSLLMTTLVISALIVVGCVDTGNDPGSGNLYINEPSDENTINPESDVTPNDNNLNEDEIINEDELDMNDPNTSDNIMPLDDTNTDLQLETEIDGE